MKDIHPNDIEKIMDHAKQIYCSKIASGIYKNHGSAVEEIDSSISLAFAFFYAERKRMKESGKP